MARSTRVRVDTALFGVPSRRLAATSFLDGDRWSKHSVTQHLQHVINQSEAVSPPSIGTKRQRAFSSAITLPALDSPRSPASSMPRVSDCDASLLTRCRPLSARSVEPSPARAAQHRSYHRSSSGQPGRTPWCRQERWRNVAVLDGEAAVVRGPVTCTSAARDACLPDDAVTAALSRDPCGAEALLPERPSGSARASSSASFRRATRLVKAGGSPAATPRLGIRAPLHCEVRNAVVVEDPPSTEAADATQGQESWEEKKSRSFGATVIQRWVRGNATRLCVKELRGAEAILGHRVATPTGPMRDLLAHQIPKPKCEGVTASNGAPSPKLSCGLVVSSAPLHFVSVSQSADAAPAAASVTLSADFATTGQAQPAEVAALDGSALAIMPSGRPCSVVNAQSETRPGSKTEANWEAPDHDPAGFRPNFSAQAAAALRDVLLNLLVETLSPGRRSRQSVDIPTSVRERYLMSCTFWDVKADSHALARLTSAGALGGSEGAAVDATPEAVSYNFTGIHVCERALVCILQALAQDPRCARISLRACQLNSISAPLLSVFLEMHPGLRHADLSRNEFCSRATESMLGGLSRRSRGLTLTGRLSQGVPETVPKLSGVTVDLADAPCGSQQFGELSNERTAVCIPGGHTLPRVEAASAGIPQG